MIGDVRNSRLFIDIMSYCRAQRGGISRVLLLAPFWMLGMNILSRKVSFPSELISRFDTYRNMTFLWRAGSEFTEPSVLKKLRIHLLKILMLI